MPVLIEQGDITARYDNAIVNSANERLLAGGGVCGAIHRAAGAELERACSLISPCPTGFAVITSGFALKARYVIHAVAPRWLDGTRGEAFLLKKCYDNVFALVTQYEITSVALPAIGTGIYHFPLEPATEIALCAAREFQMKSPHVHVTFSCFDEKTCDASRAKWAVLSEN